MGFFRKNNLKSEVLNGLLQRSRIHVIILLFVIVTESIIMIRSRYEITEGKHQRNHSQFV